MNSHAPRSRPPKSSSWSWIAALILGAAGPAYSEDAAVAEFRKSIQPVLSTYCYDCHGDGANKGNLALDELKSPEEVVDPKLWMKVLANVRAGIMPPSKKDPLPASEKVKIEDWIKKHSFKADPANPDPGRVTVRRLNRVEYRNTIRDLMGIDFKADDEFPPDDTGYGFDNIGDVLTVSPLLLEKYLTAAEMIVQEAVPTVPRVMGQSVLPAKSFTTGKKGNVERLSAYEQVALKQQFTAPADGDYELVIDLNMRGSFNFDPGRCRIELKLKDELVWKDEFGWEDNKNFKVKLDKKLAQGSYPTELTLIPLVDEPAEKKNTFVQVELNSITFRGPTAKEQWVQPKNYARFFDLESPPENAQERRAYAKRILEKFTRKAFRRPVDEAGIERLVKLGEENYSLPGARFEEGMGRAFMAVLASPRFLFRIEKGLPLKEGEKFALLDEHSLATRLAYFLWSTMPDERLNSLADKGELRKNLRIEVSRMLADEKSEAFVQNFTGQWLQARDIDGIDINARVVLRRDGGTNAAPRDLARKFMSTARPNFTGPMRQAMRKETELFFAHVLKENRPATELLKSDYTFLNETLAKMYGIEGVEGEEMRKVTLPKDSPRGGLLTQGTVLVVTSNPTRTSPVKRGLFILDNILATPVPPPPPDVPNLEDAEVKTEGREPSLRELLQVHRDKPLCSSCHERMDPLGLALENFNALGMWREEELQQAIDPTGKLISGEKFSDIRELKEILVQNHRDQFYHCLTEKLLTYALGRGVEYYDLVTIDQLVEKLKKEDGKLLSLVHGIIESAPFQKRRVGAEAKKGPQVAKGNDL